MNRWTVRIIGILILLVFVLLLFNLQRQLILMLRSRQPAATTTTSRSLARDRQDFLPDLPLLPAETLVTHRA